MMNGRIAIWLIVAAMLTLNVSGQISSFVQTMIEDATAAVSKPVRVHRINGSQFEGDFSGLIEGGFILSKEVGPDGSVEVEIRWDEVAAVEFAGDEVIGEVADLWESGDTDGTIRVLSPLFGQRSPFFRILPDAQLIPFVYLAEGYLANDQPTEALGVTRSLKTWVKDEAECYKLQSVELLCYLLLDLDPEAIQLAKSQIEGANDPSEAALAWVVMGLHHLKQQRFREAWLCAVHPILFDRRVESPDLADAYLVAILATLRLNHADFALRYYKEFEEKNLKLSYKSYQQPWVACFEMIDWDHLIRGSAAAEIHVDLESSVRTPGIMDAETVPVLRIPLVE